jgi:hypothetical protein
VPGLFSQLDIEHITDEIEDVGKSEQRELTHQMKAVGWGDGPRSPEQRSESRETTVRNQTSRSSAMKN